MQGNGKTLHPSFSWDKKMPLSASFPQEKLPAPNGSAAGKAVNGIKRRAG